VASKAREWGFDWIGDTVSLIERGKRRFSIAEFLWLPTLYNELVPEKDRPKDEESQLEERQFTLANILPDHDDVRSIRIAPQLSGPPDAVRTLVRLRGVITDPVPGGKLADLFTRPRVTELQHLDEVAVRAAKVLKEPLYVVIETAQRVWKKPFSAMRDELLTQQATPDDSPRRKQALRGHITREMLKELKVELDRSKATLRKKKGGKP